MPHSPIDPRDLAREVPVAFSGPAGRMEGLWRPPRPGRSPRAVVVAAHPHPAFGGTMMNKVVFHLARTLNHTLVAASLRFNFRGVGRSEGEHAAGRGEVDDVLAAWDEARRRAGSAVPLIAAGFSFGAAMTLLAAARAPAAPAALALIGVPAHRFPLPAPFPRPIPVAVVHGGNDAFTPPEIVGAYLESWPGPVAFHVEPEADHFLEGRLPEATGFLARALSEWL